jgi:uncharacterized Zn finger protein
MCIPNLTQATLIYNATSQSLERGENYYHSGAVTEVTLRGQVLQAEVEGNTAEPYQVSIDFDQGGIKQALCTCPYAFEGWCKHIVAVLLTCLHQPQRVTARPALVEQMAALNLEQAKHLILNLVEEFPETANWIDRYFSVTAVGSATATSQSSRQASKPIRRTAIDPTPFRKQARYLLRDAVRYWEDGGDDDPISTELGALLQEAEAFTEQGDGHSALDILAAIIDGCVDNWEDVVDYGGDSYDIFYGFDAAWAEAMLTADLTEDEALIWQEWLEHWQQALGVSFDVSLEALRQGWDDPELLQVLRGEGELETGAEDDSDPEAYSGVVAEELAQVRLKILDRQERYQEYLHLACATGLDREYLVMLSQLGQRDQVLDEAPELLNTLSDAYAVAIALREQGALEEALEIAKVGLPLAPDPSPYRTAEIFTWIGDLAEGMEDRETALAAYVAAFAVQPAFKDYQKIRTLAAEQWPQIQPQLFQALRRGRLWGSEAAKVEIYLHEGMIDAAIAVVSDLSSYSSDLILQVMSAALGTHPDWVIENACRRAESIMDAGKAQYYHHAVRWLQQAKAAYLAADRKADWQSYYSKLTSTHGRKYKLMGLMQQGL